MPANRDKSGRFLPGNNANPSGRPKENAEAKALLKAHEVEAVQRLIELMRQKSSKGIAFAAAQEILNRVQGKPETMSKIELTTSDDTKIIFQWINEDKSKKDEKNNEFEKISANLKALD